MPLIDKIVAPVISDAIKSVTDGASKIIQDFKADPNKVLDHETELKRLENEANAKILDATVQAEQEFTKQQESVNETMREESKSEHWMQWSWRPTIGFTFCFIIISNYVLFPIFHIQRIDVPSDIWTAILVILGAASAGRSVLNWQKAK